jgi:diguanylate cyclase (GGDEF)-like protein
MRLLVVDDSADDFALMRAEFSREGYVPIMRRVDTETDLRDALHTSDWDLVIADESMPSLNSRETLDIVRKSGKDMPLIICSGTMSNRVASYAMREGAEDFVAKGDFARLIPSIERELRNAEIRKAARKAESHVYRLAYYDPLTGLPNRNYFCERVDRQIAAQPDMSAAVIFFDVDNFIRLNNSFGYAIGDRLMRQIASRLEECAGGQVLLARLGGDEFAMFAQGIAGRADIDALVQSVAGKFSQPFAHDSLEFDLAVSMGIAMYPADGKDATALIANAEIAMSQAKKDPGTSFRYHDQKTAEIASRRLSLEAALRRAVERSELFLDYQPIADVRTGAILGTEALVRWRHPEFGVVAPDRFIPIADETGLIIPIGQWVLTQACTQTRMWHEQGYRTLQISVNVSAVQFAQSQLLTQVRAALAQSRLPANCLELEITETVLMRDAEATVGALKALKEMGVHVAMDDFGTGYSSLSYLKRFPIDALKIDKSFTQDISGDRDGSAIVSAITALGKSLNLRLVAEGVETIEQRDFLEKQKCDRMQGYLLSRPLSPDRIPGFLSGIALGKVA